MAPRITPALLSGVVVLALTAGASLANDLVPRHPTPEERRQMTVQLSAEGFAPCASVSLVDSRWACRARDADGRDWQLLLSNLDFAVIGRRAVE